MIFRPADACNTAALAIAALLTSLVLQLRDSSEDSVLIHLFAVIMWQAEWCENAPRAWRDWHGCIRGCDAYSGYGDGGVFRVKAANAFKIHEAVFIWYQAVDRVADRLAMVWW